jgi:hypothetical protein
MGFTALGRPSIGWLSTAPHMLQALQLLQVLTCPIGKQDRKFQVAQDLATLPPVEPLTCQPQDHFPPASMHIHYKHQTVFLDSL